MKSLMKTMKLFALTLTAALGAFYTADMVNLLYTQAAAQEAKVKCPRCGFMNPPKNPDGTVNTDCDKCGYSIVAFAADKGPSKIDAKILATYAPQMKATYNIFRNKCSKCHTLARPINTDLTPTKWEEYVKRMMKKPGSGIKPNEAKQIWEFLVYDTAKRKKALFDKMPEKEKQIAMKIVEKVENEKQ